MTKDDLVQSGWVPKECKIDTLYFRGPYFIRLVVDTAQVYSVYDDMNTIGEAKTLDDIFNIQKTYERECIKKQEEYLVLLKTAFKIKYKENI